MSIKYVPPHAPSLITSTGVLFAPKSIYKKLLSSNRIIQPTNSLIPTSTTQNTSKIDSFYIQYCNVFLTHKQPSKHHDIYDKHAVQI